VEQRDTHECLITFLLGIDKLNRTYKLIKLPLGRNIMALKKCKECGNEVSTKAKTCPKCGAPVKSSSSFGCLTIIGVLFLIGFLGSLFSEKDSTTTETENNSNSVPTKSWREQDNSIMAYIMMEDFVKQQLKAPKSADFPGILDGRAEHVKYLGNQKYRIVSYVDAQNSFGASIRNNFIGEIEQTSEDHWKLIMLDIVPR
jgi:hypothetical protein